MSLAYETGMETGPVLSHENGGLGAMSLVQVATILLSQASLSARLRTAAVEALCVRPVVHRDVPVRQGHLS